MLPAIPPLKLPGNTFIGVVAEEQARITKKQWLQMLANLLMHKREEEKNNNTFTRQLC